MMRKIRKKKSEHMTGKLGKKQGLEKMEKVEKRSRRVGSDVFHTSHSESVYAISELRGSLSGDEELLPSQGFWQGGFQG